MYLMQPCDFVCHIRGLAFVGADSMGAIAPTAKKLWGDDPKSPHVNFVMSPLYTVKRYSKITNVSL